MKASELRVGLDGREDLIGWVCKVTFGHRPKRMLVKVIGE
jgi:hypothetical protein